MSQWRRFQWTAETGDDGRFRFDRLDLRNYENLWVQADGFAERRLSCLYELVQSPLRLEEFDTGDILVERGERSWEWSGMKWAIT